MRFSGPATKARLGAAAASILGAAVLALAAAPQRDPAQAHFEKGRALFEEHDDSGDALREAEAEFRRALQLNPRLAAALAYLGFIAADGDRHAESKSAYEKALAIDPRCAEARVGLAWLHVRENRYPEAIRELRQAVAAHPKHGLARRELAEYLVHENSQPTPEMWQQAIESWEILIQLDRDDRDAHHRLAGAHERLARWADAERHYLEVLRIGQTDQDMDVWVYTVHWNVAEMLEKQGKHREAIREYEALIASEGAGDEEKERARARIQALPKAPTR